MSLLLPAGLVRKAGLLVSMVLLCCTACTPERVRPANAQVRDVAEMLRLVAAEARRSEKWPAWQATAHFSYKDRDLDAGFFLAIRHDRARAFTRVSIEGSLDQTLWADLVALGDSLALYLPLERRVLRGSRSGGSGFRASGGIRFSLHELLLLAELSPVIHTNGTVRADLLPGGGSVLVIESQGGSKSTRVEFSGEGWISAVRSIVQGRERARVVYEKRDPATGIARKQTIVSPALGMEAVVWLSSWDPAWRYRPGAEGITLPEGVSEEKM